MTIGVALDPSAVALAKAIGLIDADGAVDATWFEHPLDHLRTIIDNPVQRRALVDLLDSALPPSPTAIGLASPGEQWHPIFEYERYGVYLTIAGDIIGLAAAAATAPNPPSVRLSLRLPLIDAANGLAAIAGTTEGPLELSVSVSALGIDASAVVRVDLAGDGSLRLVVHDLDVGDGLPRTVELDPAHLQADAILVVVALVRTVLDELGAGTGAVADHLPGVLGLSPGIPLFPFERIGGDPTVFRSWLGTIAQDPTVLRQWFGHLTGLLGATSGLTGEGTEAKPWAATVLAVAGGPAIGLNLARSQAGDLLLISIGLGLAGPAVRLDATATLAAVPLGGQLPVEVLPSAQVTLVVEPPATDPAVFAVGSVNAGLRWRDGAIQPMLTLFDVTLNQRRYDVIDLSSTDAIAASAATALGTAITEGLGSTGAGHALAALIGLVAPTADPTSPHRLSVTDLAVTPTRAIAAFHLGLLSDPAHSWSALLAELGGLLGLRTDVDGDGTPEEPWLIPLAGAGLSSLHLAAWDEPVPVPSSAPGGNPDRHGLRMGLVLRASARYADAALRVGLVGFDLGDGPTPTWLVPGVVTSVAVIPPAVQTYAGGRLDIERVRVEASWRPGAPVAVTAALEALKLRADGDWIGPVNLRIPAPGGFDPTAPDLGIGIPPAILARLLGLLTAAAAEAWGGPQALVATALLGLHRRLPGLPADWPVVWPDTGPADLASLLREPVAVFREQLRRLATETSTGGVPYALPALRWLRAALLHRMAATGPLSADVLEPLPPGWGTEDHPWRLPWPGEPLAELLLWTGEGAPRAGWIAAAGWHVRNAQTATELLDRVSLAAEALPDVAGALTGRSRPGLSEGLAALDRWLADSDGIVPLISQTAVGGAWTVADPVACAHGDLPANAPAIAAIEAQLDTWAPDPGRCVLLVSAPFEDHRVWAPLLAVIDPGHAPDAHFNLRVPGADPLHIDLGEVRAVSAAYPVDLAAADPAGQLDRVVQQARSLTGAAKVVLVAHSASGLSARSYAATHSDQVAGIITLATPHAGGALGPLADGDAGAAEDAAALADAVRAAAALAGTWDRTGDTSPALRAIAFLASALDTAPTGVPTPGADVFPVAAFRTPVPAEDTVRGLAICSVGGSGAGGGAGLIGDLAHAVAQILSAQPTDEAEAVTSLAVGLLVLPTLPDRGDGPAVSAAVRVPVAEVRLADGPLPARRRRLQADAVIERTDGWLLGAQRPEHDPRERRVRWTRLGVRVAGGAGGVVVSPIGDLYDAWVPGSATRGRPVTQPLLIFSDAVARLAADAPAVSFGTLPAAGTAGALVVDALRTGGLLSIGADTLDPAILRSLVATPAAALGPLAPALAGLLLPALGFAGAGPWQIDLPRLGARLTVSADPWTAVLSTAVDPADPDWVPAAQLTGTLAMPSGVTAADATFNMGTANLRWDAGASRLVAEVAGCLAPVVLWPLPSSPGIPADLPAAAGYLLVSAAASIVATRLLPEGSRLPPLVTLIADPLRFVRDSGLFAGPAGTIDPALVNEALSGLAGLLGLAPTDAAGLPQLGLPGEFAVRAVDAPDRLLLTGTIEIGAGEHLTVDVGVSLAPTSPGSPVGDLGLTVSLPGGWGGVSVLFGAAASGLSIVVTPTGGSPIRLLPQVDGLGALAGAAVALLPSVLQTLVDEARARGPLADVPRIALDLAEQLGIYGDDADGFQRADRATELAAMLQSGWLDNRSSAAIAASATLLVDLVKAAGLGLGTVDAVGSLVRCSVDVGGGTVRISGGWSPGAAGASIATVLVELADVDLGSTVIDTIVLGYDGDLRAELRVGLRPPELVTFLQPSLELSVAVDPGDDRVGFGVDILPFGVAGRAEADVTIAPTPALLLTAEGAQHLVERWGLPLVALIALAAFQADLDAPLWDGGPSVASVLVSAGLVVPGSDPRTLVAKPPPAAQMAVRALAALAAGLSVPVADLRVHLITETRPDGSARCGVRLGGRHDIDAGDVVVSVRFGETDWLADDPDAGVTAWLLDVPAAAVPLLRPALQLTGLGAVVSGKDGPLLDTYLRLVGVGLFTFAEIAFTDAVGGPAVIVDDLGLGGQFDGAKLVISAADADSFVAKIIPSDIEADLDLAMSWRPGQGLRMYRAAAAGGLELTIPLDIDATILQITELWLRLRTGGGTTSVAAALSGQGDLGPLHLVVTRVGVEARFGANAGLAFRPPDGAGLSLDAGPVSGGGYLAHDERLYQYAGAIQLQFSAISLKALGIVTTRQPDGSPGFSLLIIISAEFTPIQLGFGFTLIGVGGLLGLNRTTDLPVLRAGVREGTIGSILFPTNLVANAPKIISDLNRVFPQAQGRFLIGPMAKIGWGTPTLISVTLGLIIELPSPIRLILLGRVHMALPTPEEAVVELNLDILGIIDFDQKLLSFDASLFNSRIAAFDVTGDMALRASWGERPIFALSAGGFHPRFSPPAGFPTLRRLAISLATGDNPRIRLESYLALTANTAQFGARLELYAEAAGFSIVGWLAFDALFQFDPFAFEVDISGGVELKSGDWALFSVTVELHLSGPRPWRARGRATALVLMIDVTISFDVTMGRPDPPPLPEAADIAALLENALDDVRSWAAQLPATAADTLFSLRMTGVAKGDLLIHPLGSLSFTQRVVPLATTVDRFGTTRPKDDTRFDVAVTIGAQPATVAAVLQDQFAPGQFFALGDDDRLSQPSFRSLPAGQQLAAAAPRRDQWLVRAAALDYELHIHDAPDQPPLAPRAAPARVRRTTASRILTVDHLDELVATSPAATAATRRAGRGRFAGPGLGLGVTAGTAR